jgi:hypothetical protein
MVGQLRRELEQAKLAAEAAERVEMELHVQLEGLEREKAEVRSVHSGLKIMTLTGGHWLSWSSSWNLRRSGRLLIKS